MKKYFVYINKLPNGTPFYVGVGTYYPNRRGYKGKHRRAFQRDLRSSAWKSAAAFGFEVEISMYSDSREDCHQKEKLLIEEYGKTVNGGSLVNDSDGGYSDLKGKKLPQWWRDKISQNVQGENNSRYGTRGQETPNARWVVNIETGIFYESVTEAADSVGMKMKSLYGMLSGHRSNRSNFQFA